MATEKNLGNNFNVTGFVVAEPKITSTTNSNKVEFGVSVSRNEGEKRISSIVNLQLWAKDTASEQVQAIHKGNLVSVDGFFKPEEWTDREGKARSAIRFVALSVKIVPRKEQK